MRFLTVIFLLVLLAALAGGGWFWYGITQPYQGFPADGVFVDVPHGASSRAVAHLLQNAGVIRSAAAFEIYARRKRPRNVQAGEYFFDHATSGRDVFWKLAKGQVYEQPFTVKEGDTMFDIAKGLDKAKMINEQEFLAAAGDPGLIRDIAPDAPTLEGFLFPATYQLSRHTAAAELTAAMVNKFREEWAAIAASSAVNDKGEQNSGAGAERAGANAAMGVPDTNPSMAKTANRQPALALVTLASLVERETPRPEERPLVAGAFANRLQRGMALQCDPTVVYGMELEHKYRGSLSGKDLKFDSPYNTYEHSGLPPGPIANPGEASLRAALHPAKTNFIYFVANTHGGHFFAATLAEHNRNVAKYRHLLAGDSAEPATPAAAAQRTPHRPLGTQRKGARP